MILQIERWTRIREYTHTTPPEVVWELVIDNGSDNDALGWTIFRGDRIQLPFVQL